ncbi:MAG: hypothetical protein WA004_17550 [Saprospiraceae bacterium]
MRNDWLEILRKKINQSDDFFSEMNYQLSKQFEKVVPESINEFKLIPPFNQQFDVQRRKNFSFIDADLLNTDIVYSVQLAWKQVGKDYEFWWLTLPFEEITTELNNRRKIEIKPNLPFEVEIKSPVWPNLEFTIHGKNKLEAKQIQDTIYKLIAQWNENEEKKGVVHNAKPPIQINNNTCSISIDLGSTGEEFLNRLLQELCGFNLERVIIDSQKM